MKYRIICFIVFINNNIVFSQNCNNEYVLDAFASIIVDSVKYSNTDGGLYMDLYSADDNLNQNKPVIVFAFGGGFVSGNRKSEEIVLLANEFAKKGFLCVSIDYRLTTPVALSNSLSATNAVLNSISDARAAIRYLRKSVTEGNVLGIDPNSIYFGGSSSGGIIALHVAYMNDVQELPLDLQFLVSNYPGGLEGNSGNEGYCSVPNGVFSFAGSILDTNFISSTDPPAFLSHASLDTVVPFSFGMNSSFPLPMYGSALINERIQNNNGYSVLDQYNTSFHPPFNSSDTNSNYAVLHNIENNLTQFLNSIMHCNSESSNSYNLTCNQVTNIESIVTSEQSDFGVIPNPFTTSLSIKNVKLNTEVIIYSITGTIVFEKRLINSNELDLSFLKQGIYVIQFTGSNGQKISMKIIKS